MGDALAGREPDLSHLDVGDRMHTLLTRSQEGGRKNGTDERKVRTCSLPSGSVPHTTNS